MAEWYERWFGEEYLALYPHRDERDAAAAIDLLQRQLAGLTSARVLDLACGAGRHIPLLRRFGWTVGLDLSPVLLRTARANDPVGPYVRADMRVLPFASASFGLVTNLFTSFGYFASDDDHERVLREVRDVLVPGGVFVLDFLNSNHVQANLIPHDERELDGAVVEQQRAVTPDGRYVVKKIILKRDGRTFVERVRLFTPHELVQMLERTGMSVTATFGDYAGTPLSALSARAILFAERT